jgi:hypothetical protein
MAAKKTVAKSTTAKEPTGKRPVVEQAAVEREIVDEVRKLLEPMSLEVLGHVESAAMCCRNGTVAIVKIDRDKMAAKPGR